MEKQSLTKRVRRLLHGDRLPKSQEPLYRFLCQKWYLMMGIIVILGSCHNQSEPAWKSLFNGEDLAGWTARGEAQWKVEEGVLIGEGGRGHLYAAPELTDLEVKGQFRLSDQGGGSNSGLYFRANPPADNPDGFPRGYEAQICHNQEAHTGWLWKPGTPTGEATALLTQDDEWFDMRIKAVGDSIHIWVNEQMVMTYADDEYKQGYFAIQCHNPGMMIEARELYYRNLVQ